MKGNISCCAACFEIETTIVLQLDSIHCPVTSIGGLGRGKAYGKGVW